MVAPPPSRPVWLLVAAGALALHPLHTTLTQLSYRSADHTVQVSVRAFADDFRAAVARRAGVALRGPDIPDSIAFTYLATALTLASSSGEPLPLAWCGLRQTGDLLWLCVSAPARRGLDGVRVHARLLFDLYADQINIVQASYDGRTASLLFSRGDPPKALPGVSDVARNSLIAR